MATVNPIEASLGRLPNINDPRYKHQLELILRQLTDYTGADTQLITSIITRETYPWPQQTPQSADDTLLYGYTAPVVLREFTAVSPTGSYDAVPWDWVDANYNVTLPLYPAENDEVIVNASKVVTVFGNGRKIAGDDKVILKRIGMSLRFKYFISADKWLVI